MTTESPTPSNHSFRNMMLLIIVAICVWSWFNFLPQHAINTFSWAHHELFGQREDQSTIDQSLVLHQPNDLNTNSTGQTTTGDLLDTQTGLMLASTVQTGTIASGNNTTGTTPTGPSIWDEVDTSTTSGNNLNTGNNATGTTTIPTPTQARGPVMSIVIGGQTITVDGNPDEDIVVNASGYTVTITKN